MASVTHEEQLSNGEWLQSRVGWDSKKKEQSACVVVTPERGFCREFRVIWRGPVTRNTHALMRGICMGYAAAVSQAVDAWHAERQERDERPDCYEVTG